ALLDDHPGLVVARAPAARVAALPGGPNAIVVIDPLGNLVLRYAENPDIKGLGRDLTRLLKASRIG
ncbi:MAG: cytochrome C oxidase subunit I, partial [Aromatoleum sp.]|nr:cytochrome C oxidase subunit I [Aromatoleum sp.]